MSGPSGRRSDQARPARNRLAHEAAAEERRQADEAAERHSGDGQDEAGRAHNS